MQLKFLPINLNYILINNISSTYSPIRREKDLREGISQIINKNYDAVWTISKIDKKFHPLKILDIKNNRIVTNSLNGNKIIARQMLDDKYIRNGILFLMLKV